MIVFAHLLNDRSGSPRVLRSAIEVLAGSNSDSILFIGGGGVGHLDEVNIPTIRYWYRRTPYRLLTLATYVLSQFTLLVQLLRTRSIRHDAIIYVNTLLPFGAAIYGWITKRSVVYHLHEVSVSPAPLRWFLVTIARNTACGLIYVSEFHRVSLPILGVPASTVYNALDVAFLAQAEQYSYQHRPNGRFQVLMLASLRDYKGVPEFLAVATRLEAHKDISFDLVANDDEAAIRRYFAQKNVPSNVTIHPRTSNTANYYSKASLVLNLSRPDQCVETFGLTLLEAMSFGIPVIAPPIGGPLELVSDGFDGFLIDCRRCEEITSKVLLMANDETLCMNLSAGAREKSARFKPDIFSLDIRSAMAFHTNKGACS